jgi:hypothetical protein
MRGTRRPSRIGAAAATRTIGSTVAAEHLATAISPQILIRLVTEGIGGPFLAGRYRRSRRRHRGGQ